MRKGVAVSPGVAVGTAYCIHEIFVDPDAKRLEDREITAELARYEAARDRVSAELQALQSKVERQVSRSAGRNLRRARSNSARQCLYQSRPWLDCQ